ncbi:uncharacterized protein LOC118339567, partial [Morone saxatilis]|uniref:uncharacterized protein LOC118339567 n=1 Tax=Morone saxatilis TaxID=34816 RepID=UPI0015E2147E
MALRLFVSYFIFTSGLVAGETVYKLKGEEFNFKPNITGHPGNILWKHNGNKVVEFDGNEQQVYSTYLNRITLDWHTADLTISDLSFEDSGDYELEAFKSGGNLETSHFNLVVIDKVANPTISCKMNNGSIISGTLMCSAEPRHPPSLMKFEWSSSGDVQPGPQLTINLGEKLDDEVYTCSVSNPLSKETATFTAKDCYPDKSSNVAAIVIPVLLLFIIIGLAVFYIIKKKACTINGKDLENQLPRGPSEDDENECKEKLINDRPEEGVAGTECSEKLLLKGSEHEAGDEPKDTAGEQKEKPDSNELDVEAAKENQSPTVPDRSGSETSVHEQDSSLSQEETHTREENQQETDKSVSGDENQKLPVSTSQQPQSPTPTTSGSGESEEQSDLSTAEADKGSEHEA